MSKMKATDAIMALNLLVLAAMLVVLVSGSGPAAFAQSGPVDLASQQRAELIDELSNLNASIAEANTQTRKRDERQQRHQEVQIELLRELGMSMTSLMNAQAAQLSTQQDELINQIEDLNGALADAVAELERLGEETAARYEEMKAKAVERDAELRSFLEEGSVTVTIGDPKEKQKKDAAPKKTAG